MNIQRNEYCEGDLNHQPNESSSVQSWLNHLRINSWEMELLITGFVLLGLLQVPSLLIDIKDVLGSQFASSFLRNSIAAMWRMLDTSVKVMILNLILLLILRGYWIGLVGLDSTIHEKVQDKQRKILTSIRKLDDVCSIIFALTFLIVFVAISSCLYLILWGLITLPIKLPVSSFLGISCTSFFLFVLLMFTLTGLFKVIDFYSLGAIGRIKKKWFARFWSIASNLVDYLTLGFLARLIYETLTKSLPRRKLQLVLVAYTAVIVIIFAGVRLETRVYYPLFGSRLGILPSEYENHAVYHSENGELSKLEVADGYSPTIQSEIITDPYLRLFIPYTADDNKSIEYSIIGIKPFHNAVMMEYISFNDRERQLDYQQKVLDYFKDSYRITIDDSVHCDYDFRFYMHPNERKFGVLTYIPLGDLPNGLHSLVLDATNNRYSRIIPFWLMRE